jgi:3-hydroxyisobutyrate dehydrogenase-like beta-hydroxyacid dehydrogenase
MPPARIGFIGLGTMGKPMAVNLVRAGFDVTVHDRVPEPVAELELLGASVAASPREIGERCDVVQVVVWDDAGVESVVLDGVLTTARPGTIVAVHSTVSLETCRRLAEAARGRGVSVIDAAISGGPPRAADGSLAIMVGGPVEAFEACRAILDAIGKQVFHVGPLGAGMAAKLCNNLMVMVNLQAVVEALRIAGAAGIETERMIEIASAGTADSWALRHGFALQQRARSQPVAGTQARMQEKDLELAVKLARELEQESAIAEFFLERARSSR